MIAVWMLVLVAGVVTAAASSRRAVTGALEIADSLGVSKGLIGVSLVAIGTDLPEIANSISASLTGHGDLNVGDSTGSALTQVTLIVAILLVAAPTLAQATGPAERDFVLPIGALTVAATLLIALLINDGTLSRLDGALLVLVWAISMAIVARWQHADNVLPVREAKLAQRDIFAVLGWLAVVAGAATLVVRAFIEVTESLGVPELIASTVVLALGTSLPELVVDWTAIRQGAAALAIGDLFGSSLVDSSLSIGIGPLFRGTDVSPEAVGSVLLVAVGITLATIVWRVGRERPRAMAAMFFGVYIASTAAIVFWTA